MARTTLTKKTSPGFWSLVGVVVTMTAADVANKNQFVAGGDDLLIVQNTGAAPNTVTITSVADPKTGRTGDVTALSLAADEVRVFRLSALGWKQADGYVYLEASSAEVKFGILSMNG
jgi:hypothetical protein